MIAGRALVAPRTHMLGLLPLDRHSAWTTVGLLRGRSVLAGVLALIVVLLLAWAMPRIALSVGLNVLPIGLSLFALHWYPPQTGLSATDLGLPALLGLLAATTSGIALARTLRALPPASAAPAAPVRR